MSFKIAERIQNLPNYPFVAINAEVGRLQSEGRHIYRMDMGSPDLPPPDAVIEKLHEVASQPNQHGYTNYRGTPTFRAAVARYYKKLFDVDLDPNSEVLPLIGSKEGLANLTLALVSPGDVVLVPTPAYPAYASTAILSQGEVYEMPLLQENRFLPDLSAIPSDIAKRARLLWVNYPNNPTGALASHADYAEMIAFCREYDILLASDNPYFAIVFGGGVAASALQAPDAKDYAVEFMSLSKSHNMAGWRLGACVGNADAVAALLRVKSNMDSGHFKAVYDAGTFALDETPDAWIDERNAKYAKRCTMLLNAMDDIGLEVPFKPEGSLYIWARVKDGDDRGYCQGALHEAGVSIVPGWTYGSQGAGFVRISLMVPEEELAGAIDGLKDWFSKRQK